MPRSAPLTMLRRASLPAAAIVSMVFFGYYAVLGPNGVLAYRDYQHQLAQREARYARLDAERADLRNRKKLLDPRHVNPDLADELVRKELNVVHPDEKIIPLN
ncbi:FtsB family cell division protein [Stakelama saccharophila]|uniref:Septum formation initiator family protein n=1 Tax=Stakelama saccharophila TaxID=3075605 RepID=A0ABZ0BD53_9SPHN|nr:septum formation initiator family protein [Stakelama sp. W311]WNO55045.1 septum formation initiator family protein [Stakelama sp. W311]